MTIHETDLTGQPPRPYEIDDAIAAATKLMDPMLMLTIPPMIAVNAGNIRRCLVYLKSLTERANVSVLDEMVTSLQAKPDAVKPVELSQEIVDLLISGNPIKLCRRCSECVGQDHHWIENDEFEDAGDPEFACKHCGAKCFAKDDDESELMEPNGVVVGYSDEGDDGE